ncbi:MAG: 6-phosphofructokinase, partial [Candidatus Omnitrophica bacterium]|nr:6-phosphofructokinase [Candidatus Omnitrophota bacterium]
GCEDVLIPEREIDLNNVCHDIVHGNLVGKMSWIIILAEGAGKADDIARQITDMTGLETRTVVLGHVQRGGRPTAFSRDLALNLGKAAVDSLIAGKKDLALGLAGGKITEVNFEIAIQKKELKIDNFYKLVKILT